MNPNSSQQVLPEPLFVFCGGGSGGHLYPAIAVCEELQEYYKGKCRFLFLTSGRSIENKVLSNQQFETVSIPSVTSQELRRQPIRSTWRLIRSTHQARKLLQSKRPVVVIGLGGYGSLPGVFAARNLKLPVVLLEQNSVAGKANELLSRVAHSICTSFPDSFRSKSLRNKIFLTGNPVRRSIRELRRTHSSTQPTLTILGGSQGAAAINSSMMILIESSPELFRDWKIYHQTGQTDNAEFHTKYLQQGIDAEVSDFFQNMEAVYQVTNLVISRAGATTLAELGVLGIPAILIPYPCSIREHQQKNAEVFAREHAARIIEQSREQNHFVANLSVCLTECLQDKSFVLHSEKKELKTIHFHAAEKVVQKILEFVPQGQKDLSALQDQARENWE